MFVFGFFVGALFVCLVIGVAYVVLQSNRSAVTRSVRRHVTNPLNSREKMVVIKSKSPTSEAWEAVRAANEQRGGVLDEEIK